MFSKKKIAELIAENETMRHRLEALGKRPKKERRDNYFLRIFIDALPNFGFSFDANGLILQVLTGDQVSARVLEGRLLAELLPQTDAEELGGALRKTFQTGERQRFEFILSFMAGRRWYQVTSFLVPGPNGEEKIAVFLFQDITNEKLAEGVLEYAHMELARQRTEKESGENHFSSLIENSLQGIYIHEDHRFLYVNQSFADLFGYSSPEEVLAVSDVSRLYAPAERDRLLEYYHERVSGGAPPVRYEYQGQRKDGSFIWLENFVQVVEWKGNRAILATAVDISERKKTQVALRESDQRLKLSLYSGKIGTFFWNVQDGTHFWDDRLHEIWGLEPGTYQGIMETNFLASIHPEDLERVKEAIGFMLEEDYEYNIEYRIILPDKDIRHVHSLATFLRDEQGQPLRVIGVGLDITERKLAEEALRESEADLIRAQQTAKIGSWRWELATNKVQWSDEMYRLYGYQPGEVEPTSELAMKPIHPKDIDRVTKNTEEALQTGGLTRTEYRMEVRNGSLKHCRGEGEIQLDSDGNPAYMIGTVQDITERKIAEEEVKRSQSLLKVVFDNSPNVIILKDVEGRYQFVNPRFEEWYGVSGDAVIGKTLWDFFPPEVVEDLVGKEQEVIRTQNVISFEQVIPLPGGKRISTFLTKFPIMGSGDNVVGVGTITTDITEMKKLEEQLRQAQKMEAMGVLAEGIAHDFNNILQPIMLFSDLLRAEIPADSQGTNFLGHITRSAVRAKELISKILLFSRQGEPVKTPSDLGVVAKEVLGLIHSTLPKSITLELTSHDDLALVLCDASQIHQVMLNLCVNAAHAIAAQGKIRIELSNVEVEGLPCFLGEDLVGKHVRIAVTDTGTGMDEETIKKIFDPFFTTKGVGEGTGMGLSSALDIVQSFGGGIVVSTELGKGSTFEIFLPVFEGEQKDTLAFKSETGGTEPILFVDDDEAIVEGWKIQMEILGYDVTGISDSAEALRIFRENPGRFALVITDQSMPEMNGDALIQEMRKLNSKVPVILYSGLKEGLSSETVSAIGINAILGKPLDKQELGRAIREVLDQV